MAKRINNMKLSILIASVPNRMKTFNVIEDLCKQAEGKEVEILYLGDNFRLKVGRKRNQLIALSTGEYVCFVDDDDRVESTYVDDILKAIEENDVDCINFHASVSIDGNAPMMCKYSKELKNENLPTMYLRQPNHLMVWRKSIIEWFPEINVGEDNHFGAKMAAKNYTEHNIDKILYHYDFNSQTTEAQKR